MDGRYDFTEYSNIPKIPKQYRFILSSFPCPSLPVTASLAYVFYGLTDRRTRYKSSYKRRIHILYG